MEELDRAAAGVVEAHVAAGTLAQGRASECRKQLAVGWKWPNDIMVNQRKVGGILSKLIDTPSPERRDLIGLVIGVGVNLNSAADELAKIDRPVWPATS